MKFSSYVFVLSVAASVFVEAKADPSQIQHGGEEDTEAINTLLGDEDQRGLRRNNRCGDKHHFVHIRLDPFSGTGTMPVPIDSDGFIEPGATVLLLEQDLLGTATYHDYDSKYTKEVSIIAQLTGSCTIVNQERLSPVETVFTSHCTVCITYQDVCAVYSSQRALWEEKKCVHPARGFITATGDIFSRYLFDNSRL